MARGSIRKRGDRSWQLTYDVPRGADGGRRQKYETVQGTKRQAEARLRELLPGKWAKRTSGRLDSVNVPSSTNSATTGGDMGSAGSHSSI